MPKEIKDGDMKTFLLFLRGDDKIKPIAKSITIKTKKRKTKFKLRCPRYVYTLRVDDDRIVGKICIGTACIVFYTPVQTIYRVIKEKNYRLIPIYNCYFVLAYGICWVIYGVFITDFYVVFPNAISIIISLIAVFIYCNYKRKYPVIGERDFSSTIGIETSTTEEPKKEENPIKMEEVVETSGKEKPVKIITKN